jgi:NAD(P)H-dependent FMN reductase
MRNPLNLGIVIGSTRQGRFAPTIANWFSARASLREDMRVDIVDLAEANLPDTLSDKPALEVTAITRRLAAADAFVIVTPEYNHSFPAPLKTAIDWHSKQWQAKPVGFVSYGGVSGGLRAVEQLRLVLAELHAVTVRDTVSFHGAWGLFTPDGLLKHPEHHERATNSMLNQISWWGHALQKAKEEQPYAP